MVISKIGDEVLVEHSLFTIIKVGDLMKIEFKSRVESIRKAKVIAKELSKVLKQIDNSEQELALKELTDLSQELKLY